MTSTLSPFEKKLEEIISSFNDGEGRKITEAGVHYYADQLIPFALQELKGKDMLKADITPKGEHYEGEEILVDQITNAVNKSILDDLKSK